ncbi:MAG: trigger factor [Pirellulales bacterium]|nr:trigger factor [Pirellulales bacterium]
MAEIKRQESDELLENEETLAPEEADKEELPPLNLEVKIDEVSTCQRHLTVTIPAEDVATYFDKEFSELMPTAQVPGFRPGRAPRKLVEARFRKDLAEKVKSELLMQSMEQIHEEHQLAAIGEPELDLDAVEIPDEGPLTFEFNLEVRPEFEAPPWKGLTIEKPVREIAAQDVEATLKRILANRGKLVPFDGPAEPGDYVTVNLTFKDGDQEISSAAEEVIRIRPVLSFRDGRVEGFDRLMAGVRAGESRQGEAGVSPDAPNAALQGKKITALFEVLEVKKLVVPELNAELLDDLGGFTDEGDLRDTIRDQLGRQLEYEQRRRARQQITAALTEAANWELPPGLLQSQSRRELERAILELQSSGFSDDEIRAHANMLRQNSVAATAKALKEHFILEKLAEAEQIEVAETDYDDEIKRIAEQTNQSPRRVRARIEKSGNMDVLRNQIIERKMIDLILEHAKFKEVPFDFEPPETEALDQSVSGPTHEELPEAKPGGEEEPDDRKHHYGGHMT